MRILTNPISVEHGELSCKVLDFSLFLLLSGHPQQSTDCAHFFHFCIAVCKLRYQLITDEVSFTLSSLHVLFVPLQGAGNFVVYVGPIFYSHIVAYRKGEKGTGKLFTLQSARPSVGARRETEESLSFDIRE